jgi:DNA-binding CsgD family transcriptional regulator
MRIGDTKKLTAREREVVELIGQGLRGRSMAARLNMAYYTLRKHRSNILRKLGLTTAAQLSAAAAAMRETSVEPDRDFRPAGIA